MPIYLCQPGASTNEPWRHGIQVYERPFPMSNDATQTTPSTTTTTNNNITTSVPEQIVVTIKLPPSQLINAPSQTSAQSTAQQIAIDNEKILALQRYLTEFISSPTDRVLYSATMEVYLFRE